MGWGSLLYDTRAGELYLALRRIPRFQHCRSEAIRFLVSRVQAGAETVEIVGDSDPERGRGYRQLFSSATCMSVPGLAELWRANGKAVKRTLWCTSESRRFGTPESLLAAWGGVRCARCRRIFREKKEEMFRLWGKCVPIPTFHVVLEPEFASPAEATFFRRFCLGESDVCHECVHEVYASLQAVANAAGALRQELTRKKKATKPCEH